MKKILIALSMLLLVLPLFPRVYTRTFLPTAVSVGTGATVSMLAATRSVPIDTDFVTIMCTFTRTTGTAAEVHFEFQCSTDGGVTWSTEELIRISIPTNAEAVSNAVRFPSVELTPGVNRIRFSRAVNDDGATALTVVNATVSWRD